MLQSPTDTALKRHCVEGLIYAAKLQALLDKHGDTIPEQVRDLAYTCIEVSEAFNTTLERIGAEQPVIIRTESKHASHFYQVRANRSQLTTHRI